MVRVGPDAFRDLPPDIDTAMRRRGFRALVVVAGHGSPRVYLPTVRATGAEFLTQHPDTKWLLLTDQALVPDLHYPYEHAAGGETSLRLAIRPDLVALDRTLETDRSLAASYAGEPRHLARRATPHKYIGLFSGDADASNDPELTATAERGQTLLTVIAARLAERARRLLTEVTSPSG